MASGRNTKKFVQCQFCIKSLGLFIPIFQTICSCPYKILKRAYHPANTITIAMESAACLRSRFLGNDPCNGKRTKAAIRSGMALLFVSTPSEMMMKQIYQSRNFQCVQKRCRNPKERKNTTSIGVSFEIRDAGKIMAGKKARRREKKRRGCLSFLLGERSAPPP